ncbi:MAG TPA: HupE/UreJ family protein [Burkholderiaceae bacterium]
MLIGFALALVGLGAQAHKASDSYLQLDAGEKTLAVRWDIALRDLDIPLVIDANDDGRVTWGEVKAAWPRIEHYAMERLNIAGCPLTLARTALERRNDGAYAVMFLTSDCALSASPHIKYSLLREVDPTHRGIAKLNRAGQPVQLMMLAPSDDTAGSAATGDAPLTSEVGNFIRAGMLHILTGYDHVLFLLCLLLPSVMRRAPGGWRPVATLKQAILPVVGIVSAFTVAHSITLGLAATKVVSLPPAFIEPAIAVTIILAALDNVWPIFPVPRVIVTFCFGLIHGFGFAGVLSELNLPAAQFAWALLQFNVGLEMGQLMIVISVTAVLFLLRDWTRYRPMVIRGGSYAAIVVGVLWLIERTANVTLLPV